MSGTLNSRRCPAYATWSAKVERRLYMLATGGVLLVLAIAGALLRLLHLSELPPGLHFDEATNGVGALQVLQGEHTAFYPENGGREGLGIYLIALAVSFLDRTVLAIRLPTALASAATVLVVFWLGRVLFGQDDESGQATPWDGLLVGGIAAGLMVTSLDQLFLGRMAFRASYLPLLLTLSLVLLWRGWRQQSIWQIVLAAICAGLLPYTYIPARSVPLLFLFFGASFLLPRAHFSSTSVRTMLLSTGVFLGVAILVAAPILLYFQLHPEHFVLRSKHLWLLNGSHGEGDLLQPILDNAKEYLSLLGFGSEQYWHRYSIRQMTLSPYAAFFFWLGVALAIWRWRQRPVYRLLLLWFAVLTLPALLAVEIGSNTFGSHHSIRMSGAVPAIYLLTAAGVWEAVHYLKTKLFHRSKTLFAATVGMIVIGLLLIRGISTYQTYFQKWAGEPDLNGAYGTAWRNLAQVLNRQPDDSGAIYVIPSPFSYWRYSLEYLYQGEASVHLVDVLSPNLPEEIREKIAEDEPSTVNLVDWNSYNFWIHEIVTPLAFLLGKYGRPSGSEDFVDFSVHSYTDISQNRSWSFFEDLEPLSVHYDGGIALLGTALGQGKQQIWRGRLNVNSSQPLWGFFRWQTSDEMNANYAVALRLYDEGGGLVYQHEDALRSFSDDRVSSLWSTEEIVDTLFYLDLPAELEEGIYELRLGVYNFETRAPAIASGTNGPEIVLARLRSSSVPSAVDADG
ncbi:MAG: hypothetical protein OXO48_02035 [Caldilineaceae bacterium]|nr:hypothetical protein [Caldilineaceae bacterium]